MQQISDYTDVSYYLEIGACYRAVGLRREAEECFNTVLEFDSKNLVARTQLAQMSRESGVPQQDLQVDEETSVRKHKMMRPTRDKSTKKSRKATAPISWSTSMLVPRPTLQPAKQIALEREHAREEDVHVLFLRRQNLIEDARMEDESSKAQWTAATKTLIDIFRGNKVFYPIDKHHKFYGYSREARNMAAKPKHEHNVLAGKEIDVPEDYCGIAFHVWLDVFLDYAVVLAQGGDIKSAYEIIATAFHANVFFHSPESQNLIHVCWFSRC